MPSLVAERPESVSFTTGIDKPFAVQRLSNSSHVDMFAPHVSELLTEYYRQFEYELFGRPDARHPLSFGSAEEKFRGANADLRQTERIRKRLADGGSYWYAGEGGRSYTLSDFSLTALATTALSKDGLWQKRGKSPANCYIGESIVKNDPRRTIGQQLIYRAAVTYSGIKYGGFDEQRQVSTDVSPADPAGIYFFETAGFSAEIEPLTEMKFRNHQRLPLRRYSGTVGHVIAAMEMEYPFLAAAVPFYSE